MDIVAKKHHISYKDGKCPSDYHQDMNRPNGAAGPPLGKVQM